MLQEGCVEGENLSFVSLHLLHLLWEAKLGGKIFYNFGILRLFQETVPCAFKLFFVMDYLKGLDSWEPPFIYTRPNTHWHISLYFWHLQEVNLAEENI